MSPEEAFHVSRRMFVKIGNILHIAYEGDRRSHEEWFKDRGWNAAMEHCVRGFVDSRGVFLYQQTKGSKWDVTDDVLKHSAMVVERLSQILNLPKGLPVYAGMVPSVPGALWQPKCRIEGLST